MLPIYCRWGWVEVSAMRLTLEMKEMVERLRLCYVATVTPDGKPKCLPKDRSKYGTIRLSCLVILPPRAPCAICAAIPSLKSIWLIRFSSWLPLKGRAELYESGPEFDFVAEALCCREERRYPVNAVVKVTIEQALPVLSPVYMFNDKVSEEG